VAVNRYAVIDKKRSIPVLFGKYIIIKYTGKPIKFWENLLHILY